MNKKGINIVLFSSGVTEKSNKLNIVINELEKKGYTCNYWRDLFYSAKDQNNIALLPMLIKKIPTFDFAILICEGHDKTIIKRDTIQEVNTMRDNVLFEIGLSTMALGLSHVILLTDNKVHLPEDLSGSKKEKIKIIKFTSNDDIKQKVISIDKYIQNKIDKISPVVIGAAATTACGYVENFILRILQNIDKDFQLENQVKTYEAKDIYMHIVLPANYSQTSDKKARCYLKKYQKGTILNAGSRAVYFHYKQIGNKLHIYDCPTTLVTSYNTAKLILDIDANDKKDKSAKKRFIDKEMRLFKYTLDDLLSNENRKTYIKDSINRNNSTSHLSKNKKETLLKNTLYIIKHNLTIEVVDY